MSQTPRCSYCHPLRSLVCSLEQCQSRLQSDGLPSSERGQLLWLEGNLLAQQGRYQEAIASYSQSISSYAHLDAHFWCDRGDVLRHLEQHENALMSYDRALTIQPQNDIAWSGRGVVLSLLGRQKEAIACCSRAIELQPTSAEAWNARGIVLLMGKRYQEAIAHFDQSLSLHPQFDKALNNRGLALLHLGRTQEAAEVLQLLLTQPLQQHESWYSTTWTFYGYALLKLGQFEEAIACFDQTLQINPKSAPAAFYRLISLALSGHMLSHLGQLQTRQAFTRDCQTILFSARYGFAVAIAWLVTLIFATGRWGLWLREGTAVLLSIAVVLFLVIDLWRHKSRLSFVWQTYAYQKPLTYLRAGSIVALTVITYAIAASLAPPFLHWSWANLIFDRPGNLLFQPLQLLEGNYPGSIAPLTSLLFSLIGTIAAAPLHPLYRLLAEPVFAIAPGSYPSALTTTLILLFWLLLVVGIPFWARFEERIFRLGANTWKQITVRSTQFGLVHLLAGIPILGGLILILPGFLFAWRYRYVCDRHLKATGDLKASQAAGIAASTVDHALYNAILVTMAIVILLFTLMPI